MAMIEVKNLTKRYRDRVAIDGLNFSVNEGEILGFLGPNGAGKTTTMRILTGFLPASAGSAEIRSLIRGIAGKHTVILYTHIIREVTMTCEKVLIINQGKIAAFDEIKNLAPAYGQTEQVSLEEIFIKLTAA